MPGFIQEHKSPRDYTIPDIVKELSLMRTEIQQLRDENQRLRQLLLEGPLRNHQKQFIADYVRQLVEDGTAPTSFHGSGIAGTTPKRRPQRVVSSLLDRAVVAASLDSSGELSPSHSFGSSSISGPTPSAASSSSSSSGPRSLGQLREILSSSERKGSAIARTTDELSIRLNPLHNRPNIVLRGPTREASKSARTHSLSATKKGPGRAALLSNKVAIQWPSQVPDTSLVASVSGYIAECGSPADLLTKLDADSVSLTPSVIEYSANIFIRLFSNKPYQVYIPASESPEPLIVCSIDDVDCSDLIDSVSPPISPTGGSAISPRTPQAKHTVMVRTAKGDDLLSMPNSAIPTIFQMSGITGVQEVPYLQIHDELLAYSQEQRSLFGQLKVGVLLSIGEQSEDEMFANQNATPLFQEFLDWLGNPIKLQGWEGFRGGLDVKTNTTGKITYYAELDNNDDGKIPLLFHVSTLLPYNPNDKQQLERKRHLGNDLVMIVFRENPKSQFDPREITSHFNFIFVVVKPIVNPEDPTSALQYEINITARDEVTPAGPYLENPPLLAKTEDGRRRFHLKLCNAERAALESEALAAKLDRSRAYSLQLLSQKHRIPELPKTTSKKHKRAKSLRKGSSISKALGRTDSR